MSGKEGSLIANIRGVWQQLPSPHSEIYARSAESSMHVYGQHRGNSWWINQYRSTAIEGVWTPKLYPCITKWGSGVRDGGSGFYMMCGPVIS